HDLRQRQQPRSVTGRCGVEDQQVVVVEGVFGQLGDALEDRRFVGAGGVAGQLQVLIDLLVQMLGPKVSEAGSDIGQMRIDGGLRVDLNSGEDPAGVVVG